MSSIQADGIHAPVVLIGTFNMSQRTIEQDLSDWLATHPSLSTVQPPSSPTTPESPSSQTTLMLPPLIPDMVAIALQEIVPYPDAFIHGTYNIQQLIDQMANLVLKTLVKTCPGYQFSLLTQVAQVGMVLLVFTRDETMTPYIQSVSNASVGTGPLGMGNKGAVATKVSVNLPYPSRPFEVCFINAHLSAHLDNIRRRNDDYLAICRRMIFVEENGRFKDNANSNNNNNNNSNNTNPNSTTADNYNNQSNVGEDDDDNDDEDLHTMDQDRLPLLNGQDQGSQHDGSRKRNKKSKRTRKFGSSKKPSIEKTIFSCDYIFWTGDLNYRLDLEESSGSLKKPSKKKPSREDLLSQSTPPPMSASEFVHAIEAGRYRPLYSHDQLSAQRKTMNVFKGFHEAPLAFAPTYKFLKGTSKYDIRKRIPAWTDRVLWYVHPRDADSLEAAKEDEVDAWDEHSAGLGQGKLPMESAVKRRARSYCASSDFAPATVESIAAAADVFDGPLNRSLAGHRSDTMSSTGSRSRGTFSSLAKRGNTRIPIDQQLFQPPSTTAATTLSSSLSSASLASSLLNQEAPTVNGGNGVLPTPSMPNMSATTATGTSSLNNRSARNSGAFAREPSQWSALSSSSSLLQPQHMAQGVDKCQSPLLIHYYTSHPYYISSDHKPVSALFTLLPHNLATQLEISPYGIDPYWRIKKFIGQKLTTVAGHVLRWGFLVLGIVVLTGLFVFVRRHLHGW
ncbi:hypothetical protein BGW41_004807 [Actinomortierella wolfii]|nr:hypothetical protein BGW41_004807 [Actinomortierella wolfii]